MCVVSSPSLARPAAARQQVAVTNDRGVLRLAICAGDRVLLSLADPCELTQTLGPFPAGSVNCVSWTASGDALAVGVGATARNLGAATGADFALAPAPMPLEAGLADDRLRPGAVAFGLVVFVLLILLNS